VSQILGKDFDVIRARHFKSIQDALKKYRIQQSCCRKKLKIYHMAVEDFTPEEDTPSDPDNIESFLCITGNNDTEHQKYFSKKTRDQNIRNKE
jgi:hypothetical protein